MKDNSKKIWDEWVNKKLNHMINEEDDDNETLNDVEDDNDTISDDDISENGSFVNLVSKILHSRTQIHIYHLQTESFAEHKALNDYYDGIIGLFDGLVESYQGKYDIIKGYDCDGYDDYSGIDHTINYLKELDKTITSNRKSIKESYIQNQIDTVQELIYSTLYKLRFLK